MTTPQNCTCPRDHSVNKIIKIARALRLKWLAFDPVTVLSRLENLRDSVTDEKKPPWPGDFVVSPVAALSIAPMGVTTPCFSIGVQVHQGFVTAALIQAMNIRNA